MGFAMAALALLAIYLSTAPHDTFEDEFAGDSDSQAETVTYTPPVNLFGQQIMGRESGIQDPLLQEEGPASPQNDLAG